MGAVCLRLLPDSVAAAIITQALLRLSPEPPSPRKTRTWTCVLSLSLLLLICKPTCGQPCGGSVADGSDAFTETSLASDLAVPPPSSHSAEVCVGRHRLIQVFITHSASVFLVGHPPTLTTAATVNAREVASELLLRLEDQVGQLWVRVRISSVVSG